MLSGGNNGVVRLGRCGAQSAVLGPEGREMKLESVSNDIELDVLYMFLRQLQCKSVLPKIVP
jgi:hypothetical protein